MHFDGIGIFVENMPKMIKFYRDVLGFEIKENENTENVYMTKNNTVFMLYRRKDFEKMTSTKFDYTKGICGHFEIALSVSSFYDVDNTFSTVVKKGATPVMMPKTMPWGQRTSYIADIEGNLIEIGSFNK